MEPKNTTIAVRLPSSLFLRLRALAAGTDLPVSHVVREALRQYLGRLDVI